MRFGTKRGFVATRRHGVELHLRPSECDVLLTLLEQLDALVGPAEPHPAAAQDDPLAQLLAPTDDARPQDPALLRLFPDGYTDDDEASSEFRRFTQGGLRQLKSGRLGVTREVLDRLVKTAGSESTGRTADSSDAVVAIPVTENETTAMLGAFNDLRLVLGVRLAIVDDDQDVTATWSDDDPRHGMFGAYQWLTWLQATLLEAIG